MNANELAGKLEDKDRLWSIDEELMIKTCTMLRQQQAEIEALKRDCINYLKDNTRLSDQILLLKKDK